METDRDIELSLLVIDLGTSVVVKVEKGRGMELLERVLNQDHPPFVMTRTFAEVRQAIDGEKSVPRIERTSSGVMPLFAVYYSIPFIDEPESIALTAESVEALSQLAGKPLPIWEGGKWERLLASESKIGTDIGGDVSIWRYTR